MGTTALEQALAEWLPSQRWFAGKGRPITGLSIAAGTELTGHGGDPALWHLIAAVTQAKRERQAEQERPAERERQAKRERQGTVTDHYQVLVGLRAELPGRLEHVRIARLPGGRTAYDGLHDHELARVLLHGIADEKAYGPLRLRRVSAEPLRAGPLSSQNIESLVMTAEQSNTSLVYGEEAILKVFRRVAPGPNPDLEVSIALSRLGSPHVAEPLGWMEMGGSGEADTTILGILSRYLPAANDGWSLAAASVRDLYAGQDEGHLTAAAEAGGDFAGEASRLGAATAEVHDGLARAFGTAILPPDAAGDLAAGMRHRLEQAVIAVPALREQAGQVDAAYQALAALREPIAVQRIHGDYHLGQVLRTQAGWVVLDFEGEPAVPLAARRERFPAMRDVAGMLRSFDYAARHQLLGHRDRAALELPARDWVGRNAGAFCAGYARASGVDPRDHGVLLRALQFDKAVYEVSYEAKNRPAWLPIPLDSLAAAAGVAAAASDPGREDPS